MNNLLNPKVFKYKVYTREDVDDDILAHSHLKEIKSQAQSDIGLFWAVINIS
jgi:hypothetical protein